MEQKANFDTTYCQSLTCKKKCWRHVSNFEFEEGKHYWFQDKCENKNNVINIPINEERVYLNED